MASTGMPITRADSNRNARFCVKRSTPAILGSSFSCTSMTSRAVSAMDMRGGVGMIDLAFQASTTWSLESHGIDLEAGFKPIMLHRWLPPF